MQKGPAISRWNRLPCPRRVLMKPDTGRARLSGSTLPTGASCGRPSSGKGPPKRQPRPDRAAAMTAPRTTMTDVEPLAERWVRLTFGHGAVHEVDLVDLLSAGGVFASIRDGVAGRRRSRSRRVPRRPDSGLRKSPAPASHPGGLILAVRTAGQSRRGDAHQPRSGAQTSENRR